MNDDGIITCCCGNGTFESVRSFKAGESIPCEGTAIVRSGSWLVLATCACGMRTVLACGPCSAVLEVSGGNVCNGKFNVDLSLLPQVGCGMLLGDAKIAER